VTNKRTGKPPLSDVEALEQVCGRPFRELSPTVLAKSWGWSRAKVRRRIEAWKDAGHLVGSKKAEPPRAIGRPAEAKFVAGRPPRSWFNTIALLAAGAIASVSGYFSILGLAALFAAAFWPVIVMGTVLEVGKLVTASWLSRHWLSTPGPLKGTLTAMVVMLVTITSTGVYGFLAKAHLDHSVHASIVVADQAAIIEAKIAVQAQMVSDFDRRISQIDAAIEAATSRGRSIAAMTLASQERKARAELVENRQREARVLADLQVRKASIAGERKRVEAEVGPIRYLAQLVAGADANLEAAVKLLILAIAGVFDPFAVLLLIAATRDGRAVSRSSL
jgi:hypothetical protein